MARRRRRRHIIVIRRKRGKGLVGDILRAAPQPIKQRIKKKVKNVAKIVTTPFKGIAQGIKKYIHI